LDTLSWIAQQEWSTGEVAMAGLSYFGANQWLVATRRPSGLFAIAPQVTSGSFYDSWTYRGGALQLGFVLLWTLLHLALPDVVRSALQADREAATSQLINSVDSIEDLYRRMPLNSVPGLDTTAPYYREWLDHPTYDEYWRATAAQEHYDDVIVPSLIVGGWYDCFLPGTLASYHGVRTHGASGDARSPRLIIGPWAHGTMLGEYSEAMFGLAANVLVEDLTGTQIEFFDAHLANARQRSADLHDGGRAGPPPVRLFIMGSNTWRDEDAWPPAGAELVRYYLGSTDGANTADGDGVLATAVPEADRFDEYRYDPMDPVPTVGGATFLPGLQVAANAGPRDQRSVEQRADVLCYTTLPLGRDTEVIGPISLVLYVASSARDTDFTGKLVDVHPDGRAIILTDGILRARYRESLEHAKMLAAGNVYMLNVDMGATANVFLKGHRIRVEVSSSNFPRFDRNTNTGGVIAAESDSEAVPATNRVYHGPRHPGHVLLPVVRR
jgi:hypothetical protein